MKKTNMKKFLLLFCMLACVFSMTACSDTISADSAKESAKKQDVVYSQNGIAEWATDMIVFLNQATDDQITSYAEAAQTLDSVYGKSYVVNPDGMNDQTIEFYNGWIKSREDLGSIKSVDGISITVSEKNSELCSVSVSTTFEKRTCEFVFTLDKDLNLVSGAINPTYTTGEKLEKAGLNTLLGMGTVFIVLIFISFIIAQFKHINKIVTKKKEEVPAAPVVNEAVQIEPVEEEVDDLELIAVITAAIAASENTSADGLVVRSIKKVNKTNNWRR